ncbi:MAG TPA: GTPase Era [Woeseiaceae bacterium]|nr:GTPase Era [Woeseiaceae bacterium]
MEEERPHRSGFVAVVGRPNVGKSTLINSLVGSKVSIVTPKPQTTRHRILGIRNEARSQIVFIDTPGLHTDARKAMNRLMNRAADSAIRDADVVLFLVEANRWTTEDTHALKRIAAAGASPVIAVINKIDKVHPKEELLRVIEEMAARFTFAEVVPVSALRKENLDRLVSLLPDYLQESPPFFPETAVSDRNERFRAAELIREKLTLALRQEVPYGLTVQVERFETEAQGLAVAALILVERESQKGIVVGKGGALLKKAGRAVRLELKEQYGMPVHLDLWVKVRDNWADSEEQLLRLGYDQG